ncbi:SDR family oxidoreductase [Streptomyces bugieae]|uniref:SDR family oxidoreductase n=1 Tax=Streptomyces bugieae TaxID=3098223 RepID=A0ABU7P1W9_9ACTN|nr:SDR family oxidoreductase [Streptomyces sp. DSM 41528]
MAPGATLTEMIRAWEENTPGVLERLTAQTPLRRIADPDEIAQTAAWLLSDRSSYVTTVSSGWTAAPGPDRAVTPVASATGAGALSQHGHVRRRTAARPSRM